MSLALHTRRRLSASPRAHPLLLVVLSYDPDEYVAENVAANRRTWKRTLHRLGRHEESTVALEVACNQNTAPKTLAFLARREDWLRSMPPCDAAWSNPNLPQEMLVGVPDKYWYAALHNPNLTADEVLRWIETIGHAYAREFDPNEEDTTTWNQWNDLVEEILAREDLPERVWRLLAGYAMPAALKRIALRHPNCPTFLVESSCSSPNPIVREAALKAALQDPECSEHIRVTAALLRP